ncbi:hypothetical protein EDD16DRAFT_1578914 [Pisolithus croceorrhizus]|nr:hypothetical protein EDD16DRAFT_1578914 [Pisolithus croceorrhizus]KAI6123343.1 hypothetical protein EV401DRAFT_1948032 [Pisolithus croceorrhizus]
MHFVATCDSTSPASLLNATAALEVQSLGNPPAPNGKSGKIYLSVTLPQIHSTLAGMSMTTHTTEESTEADQCSLSRNCDRFPRPWHEMCPRILPIQNEKPEESTNCLRAVIYHCSGNFSAKTSDCPLHEEPNVSANPNEGTRISCQPKHAKAKDGVDLDLLSKRILSLLQTKKVDRVSVATAHNGSSARKTRAHDVLRSDGTT